MTHLLLSSVWFQEHFNFVGTDDQLGPVLLSVKTESLASQEQTRLLLRLRTGTTHELVPSSCATSAPHHMARVSSNTIILYYIITKYTVEDETY